MRGAAQFNDAAGKLGTPAKDMVAMNTNILNSMKNFNGDLARIWQPAQLPARRCFFPLSGKTSVRKKTTEQRLFVSESQGSKEEKRQLMPLDDVSAVPHLSLAAALEERLERARQERA